MVRSVSHSNVFDAMADFNPKTGTSDCAVEFESVIVIVVNIGVEALLALHIGEEVADTYDVGYRRTLSMQAQSYRFALSIRCTYVQSCHNHSFCAEGLGCKPRWMLTSARGS
jgi:hypothetical protein